MQVHHKPTREQKLQKRLEDFVTLVEFSNIMNSLKDLVILIEALAIDDVQNWKEIVEKYEFFEKEQHKDIIKASSKSQKYRLQVCVSN